MEKEDPKEAVEKYLINCRAVPHKTTGKLPYEMMFRRKMKTKLPGTNKTRKWKPKQKQDTTKKNKAIDKNIQEGSSVMIRQKKTTT